MLVIIFEILSCTTIHIIDFIVLPVNALVKQQKHVDLWRNCEWILGWFRRYAWTEKDASQ